MYCSYIILGFGFGELAAAAPSTLTFPDQPDTYSTSMVLVYNFDCHPQRSHAPVSLIKMAEAWVEMGGGYSGRKHFARARSF